MSERRCTVRNRTLFEGRIIIDGVATFNCFVRDLSSSGARLVCWAFPYKGAISLEIKAIPGFKRDAKVVWRELDYCGVKFV
jgi:hypothetical protein